MSALATALEAMPRRQLRKVLVKRAKTADGRRMLEMHLSEMRRAAIAHVIRGDKADADLERLKGVIEEIELALGITVEREL